MDKPNMPLKRPRKHSDFHKRNIISNNFAAKVQRKKQPRRDDLGWLKKIFKVFESVRDWFGGWFGGHGEVVTRKKPDKRYTPQEANKRSRNRRRNQIAKESRRVNR